MPTKHRRIAVVADPDLLDVIENASSRFPGESSASVLKELAFIGAKSLDDDESMSPKLRRLLDMPGVRPAKGNLKDFLAERPDRSVPEGTDPFSGTKALREQREERF